MLALLSILLIVLAWSHRGRLVLVPDQAESAARVVQPSSPSQVYFGPPNSIAVLPFNCRRYPVPEPAVPEGGDNGSAGGGADPALAFGLAESVLDYLVRISGLQVTASASSSFFADSIEALPVLTERLKVRHLLDGCVQRDDDSLRLEVSLYDVRAGAPAWSQRFDFPIGDVFGVMNRITVQVADAVREGAGAEAPAPRTGPVEAWLRLMEGRRYAGLPEPGSLDRAETAYQEALGIEPGLAPAWIALAELYLQPSWTPPDPTPAYEHSRQAAERALELDPGSARAHLVLSRIGRIDDWDFERAHQEAQRALKLLPGDADVLENAGAVEIIFGRFQPAIRLLERAISRNPVVLNKLLRLGLAYEFAGDYDQSLVVYRQLLNLNPDFPGVYAFRARVKLDQQNPESALKEAEQETQPFWRRYARILALDALDRFEESDPLLEAMVRENSDNAAFQLAEIHAMRGDVESAFEWLERAREQHDGGMSEILGNPFLASLHDDDRWEELVRRLGLRP